MTGFAFSTYFILYINVVIGLGWFMAFITCQVFMLTIQFKRCNIMIEFAWFPVVEYMTTAAISGTFFVKLIEMFVLMT
jgi:hypothetical protein